MNITELKRVSMRIAVVIALLIISCVLEAQAQTLQKVDFLFNRALAVDVPALRQLSDEVSSYLATVHKSQYVKVDEGSLFISIITLGDVQTTIDFLAKTAHEHPQWLRTHWFYTHFFDFYRLYSDGTVCPAKIGPLPRGWEGAPEALRITQYRICKIHGSKNKTKQFPFPLYAVPDDEKGKKPSYIKTHHTDFLRFKHTKNNIFQGALVTSTLTRPVAWVTLEGYKELVMQGSAVIDFSDGTEPQRYQAISSNGRTTKEEQYWFVAPYEQQKPSKKFPRKVDPVPGVSFAGNITQLGFGKVIVTVGKNPQTLEQEMRVGILVDTGNAFQDNLCKLDLFTGYFENHHSFDEHRKQYPHTAQVYILIKKRTKKAQSNKKEDAGASSLVPTGKR